MTDSIVQELSNYIAKDILKQPNRQIASEEALISAGLIDSFSLVDLSLHVEDRYGVHIDDTELTADTFDTLAALASLIRQRQH